MKTVEQIKEQISFLENQVAKNIVKIDEIRAKEDEQASSGELAAISYEPMILKNENKTFIAMINALKWALELPQKIM